MKVSKRERKLLLVVLVMLVIGAYYLLFLNPYLAEASDLDTQLTSKETQVQTYTQIKANVDAINEKINERQKEIENFGDNITIGFDQPPIIAYLEDTVWKHAQKGMFKFTPPEQVGQLTISPVSINMVTTYDELKSFIDEVTNGDYIINVTKLYVEIITPEVDEEEVAATQTTTENGQVIEEPPVIVIEEVEPVSRLESVLEYKDNEKLLNIILTLEIYSMTGDVPPDTVYSFEDRSYEYGGDIFY